MTSQLPPTQQTAPVRVKSVHSDFYYQSDILGDARIAVLHDLGSSIPEIPFKTFLKHLTPPQPDFDMTTTINWLKSKKIGALTSSNKWKGFSKAPKDQRSEDAAFKPLLNIFSGVVKAIVLASRGKRTESDQSVDYIQHPNQVLASAERHNASRPDGYLVLKDRKGDIQWADIVLSCEFKRNDRDADRDDDVRKVLWSMQHIMRDDPRRRATFGMTIENFTTRIWFCCRSSVVVSEPFDFTADLESLIKLFAAFAFADQKSLGFDPTMEMCEDDQKQTQFIISVHPHDKKQQPRKFRTLRLISSYGAEPLRGRGTRVFKVIEIDQSECYKGLPVVLKDIWIDNDRTKEGFILEQLHLEADDEDKQLVERHFLNTVCHGYVWTDDATLDDTNNTLMRGLDLTTYKTFKLQKGSLQRYPLATGSEGLLAVSRFRAPHSHARYSPKTHYRIVFEEEGITIDRITSLPEVMKALTETARALQLLRKLGWVHRDVSVGNIFWCNGVAKLADLEYAKKIGGANGHEMRTGTTHFMPIEVAVMKYLFLPPRQARSIDEVEQAIRETKQDPTADVSFSYNHLHDLESLWWVAVWVVFHNYFLAPDDLSCEFDEQDVKKQLIQAQILFPSTVDSTSRLIGFQTSFEGAYLGLPSNKHNICRLLDGLREILIGRYKDIEATLPDDIKSPDDDIYESFNKAFSSSKIIPNVKLVFIPELYTNPGKRQRSESMKDAGVATKTQRKKW